MIRHALCIALLLPACSETSSAASSDHVPDALKGRWGLVPADCTSTKGDAKGLLTIGDTRLDYYESRGTIQTIASKSPTRIEATIDFVGEGISWTYDMTLDAQNHGTTLVTRSYGEGAPPGALKYTACP